MTAFRLFKNRTRNKNGFSDGDGYGSSNGSDAGGGYGDSTNRYGDGTGEGNYPGDGTSVSGYFDGNGGGNGAHQPVLLCVDPSHMAARAINLIVRMRPP